MKRHIWLAAAAVVAYLSGAAAQAAEELVGDPDKGRLIFLNGKGDEVPACASCHGEDGLGSDDMNTPRLAYQVDTYILKQLTDFATGKRMDNVMFQMNDIASALTPEERADVAAYVHQLKTPFFGSDLDALKEAGEDVGNVARGWAIVNFGAPERGIPACKSCHGFNGRAAGRLFPAIGGQRYLYLKHELEAFRLGATTSHEEDPNARDNDPEVGGVGMMRAVAAKLSDQDIKDIAAFLTQAPPVTPGNPQAPRRK